MEATTRNWLIGLGCAVVLASGITYYATQPSSDSERTSLSTTPQAQINITTAGEVPLTFQMSTATVDMCFIGAPENVRERNLLEPTFLLQQQALGFNRAHIFADGSVMQSSHLPTHPSKGSGYNGNPKDFATYQEYAEAMNGVLVQNWKADFFGSTLAFVKAVGIPMDVTLNKRDAWKQNKARIDSTKAEYIKLWSEVKILKDTNGEWQNYLKWAIAMRDSIKKYYGETKKIIADEPNIYQKDKKSMVWRVNINPTSLAGIYGADNYWQTGDQNNYTANQDSKIIIMNKIKIHYTISQPLCGEIKRVCVVGNSELQCGCAMQQYFPMPNFSWVESWREEVDGNTKSELLQDNVSGHSDNAVQSQNS